MYRPKNMNHIMTGIFLILVALLAFYLSRKLSTFSSVGMGPGFAPRMMASLQILFGLLLIASGFLMPAESNGEWQLRPLIVLAAIAFFGVTIEPMGLVIAVMGLVLIACAASRETKVFEAFSLAIGAAIFSVLIFATALRLTIPIWPTGLFGG
jgi:putative tricarboxylic transport membrane protein